MPPQPTDKFYMLLDAIDAANFASLKTAWIAFQTELGTMESDLASWMTLLAEAEIEDLPDYTDRYSDPEDYMRNPMEELILMRKLAGRVTRQLKKLKQWEAQTRSDLNIT